MEFIGPKLYKDQFGATKGKSITHYVIELVNFILFIQDLKSPRAVLCLTVDLYKAFNRVEHSDVVTSLHEMGTPPWLLKNRELRGRMNGKICLVVALKVQFLDFLSSELRRYHTRQKGFFLHFFLLSKILHILFL